MPHVIISCDEFVVHIFPYDKIRYRTTGQLDVTVLVVTTLCFRFRRVGATSDRRADQRHAELGDGVQEVVSRLQDSHLLRHPERTQGEKNGQ